MDEMPLVLYHGGAAGCADRVLREGLKPSWDGFTYLALERAAVYAGYRSNHTSAPIFKVRVEEQDLYPDSDYMYIFHKETEISAQKNSKHLWKESLDKFGQVAILGGISKENVLDYRLVNFKRWRPRLTSVQKEAFDWVGRGGGESLVDWDAQKKLHAVSREIMEMAFEGEIDGQHTRVDTDD